MACPWKCGPSASKCRRSASALNRNAPFIVPTMMRTSPAAIADLPSSGSWSEPGYPAGPTAAWFAGHRRGKPGQDDQHQGGRDGTRRPQPRQGSQQDPQQGPGAEGPGQGGRRPGQPRPVAGGRGPRRADQGEPQAGRREGQGRVPAQALSRTTYVFDPNSQLDTSQVEDTRGSRVPGPI